MDLLPNKEYRLESHNQSTPVWTDDDSNLMLDDVEINPRWTYKLRDVKLGIAKVFSPKTYNPNPLLVIRGVANTLYSVRTKKKVLDGVTDENGYLVVQLEPGEEYRVHNNQGYRQIVKT